MLGFLITILFIIVGFIGIVMQNAETILLIICVIPLIIGIYVFIAKVFGEKGLNIASFALIVGVIVLLLGILLYNTVGLFFIKAPFFRYRKDYGSSEISLDDRVREQMIGKTYRVNCDGETSHPREKWYKKIKIEILDDNTLSYELGYYVETGGITQIPKTKRVKLIEKGKCEYEIKKEFLDYCYLYFGDRSYSIMLDNDLNVERLKVRSNRIEK